MHKSVIGHKPQSNMRKKKLKSIPDEKLCMTKSQMRNIVHAAENPRDPNCCPHAVKFVRQLKKEVS